MRKISLAGEWGVFMDASKCESIPKQFHETIELPNTTSNARLGEQNSAREIGFMTDLYSFEGYAWFYKTVEIDEDFANQKAIFHIERTRKSALYINGEYIGEQDSLTTSHNYEINALKKGENTILVRIDNTNYKTRGGHMTSPDTQTNWNGMTGEISITSCENAIIKNVQIYSTKNCVRVTGQMSKSYAGNVRISVYDINQSYYEETHKMDGIHIDAELNMKNDLPLWDEHAPNLLTLALSYEDQTDCIKFGVRNIHHDGLQLTINGHPTFLRGKHDGLVFPLTGFAPTNKEAWLEVFEIAKDYGINHYRFHTCCPPKAAFEAADEIGMYLEPELPFWGTITTKDDENHNEIEQAYLIEEGRRILREFGNHPSFMFMSLGNELWGSQEKLNDILKEYKTQDNRHFYTSGSNNFQFFPAILEQEDFFTGVRFAKERLFRGSYAMCDAPQGHIQLKPPSSNYDYDEMILPNHIKSQSSSGKILIQYETGVKEVSVETSNEMIPTLPVVSHEIGQYYIYPDYDEKAQYTGAIQPLYLDFYKEKAMNNHMLAFAKDFFKASGMLAVSCYKAELESAIATENLSGFQLLDLQDFPGQGVASVGVLNSLMQSKGLITPMKWRGFCDKTVLLARFEKFVYQAGEAIKGTILVSNIDPKLVNGEVSYVFSKHDGTLESGKQVFEQGSKRISLVGEIEFDTSCIKEPTNICFTIRLDNTLIENTYEFFVFPEVAINITKEKITYLDNEIMIAQTKEQVIEFSKQHKKILYIPLQKESLNATYCTDFWCYSMFSSISKSMNKPLPIGTLGLLVDDEHDSLRGFETKSYTTPQWYSIIEHSHCENLTETLIEPIVWMIDNPERCQKFGILFEEEINKEKILVCTCRLWEAAQTAEVLQFAKGLCEYIING